MSRYKIPDELEWSQEAHETLAGEATRDTAREVWRQVMCGEFNVELLDFLREFAARVIEIDTDASVPKQRRLELIGKATGLVGDEDEHSELRAFIAGASMFADVTDRELLEQARASELIATLEDSRNERTDAEELKLIARLRGQPKKRPRGGRKRSPD